MKNPLLVDGNDIYFATYTSSRKVRHYRNNTKACVYFIEKGKTTYEIKDSKVPYGSIIKLCFLSDFFMDAGLFRTNIDLMCSLHVDRPHLLHNLTPNLIFKGLTLFSRLQKK